MSRRPESALHGSSPGPPPMPMAVTEYGLTATEHMALKLKSEVPLLPWLPCPRCCSPMRSKGLVFRKRVQVWLRQGRCTNADCRCVVTLLPPWACVGIAATMAEVEAVVETREAGGSWREAAVAAGLEFKPRKFLGWLRKFSATMCAMLPLVPGLMLGCGGGWVPAARVALGVEGPGVLVALRWQLYRQEGVVFGPLRLLTHDRIAGRGPPVPRMTLLRNPPGMGHGVAYARQQSKPGRKGRG